MTKHSHGKSPFLIGKPSIFMGHFPVSDGFPMVFLWFSHENLHFPMVFPWFSPAFFGFEEDRLVAAIAKHRGHELLMDAVIIHR